MYAHVQVRMYSTNNNTECSTAVPFLLIIITTHVHRWAYLTIIEFLSTHPQKGHSCSVGTGMELV